MTLGPLTSECLLYQLSRFYYGSNFYLIDFLLLENDIHERCLIAERSNFSCIWDDGSVHKCSLYELEDLSLGPHHAYKKPSVAVCIYTSLPGGGERKDVTWSTANHSSQPLSFKISKERLCANKKDGAS